MAGTCRWTGRAINTFDSTMQGVEVILSTRLRSRVMRRGFGGGLIELLGRRITAALFPALMQLIATTINRWEPRLNVRRVSVTGSVDDLRLGTAKLKIEADYRPRALETPPDLTVDRTLDLHFTNDNGQMRYVA